MNKYWVLSICAGLSLLTVACVLDARAADISHASCLPTNDGDCDSSEYGGPAGTYSCPDFATICDNPCNRCTGNIGPHTKICWAVYNESAVTCPQNGTAPCGTKKIGSCEVQTTYCQCPDAENCADAGSCGNIPTCG